MLAGLAVALPEELQRPPNGTVAGRWHGSQLPDGQMRRRSTLPLQAGRRGAPRPRRLLLPTRSTLSRSRGSTYCPTRGCVRIRLHLRFWQVHGDEVREWLPAEVSS